MGFGRQNTRAHRPDYGTSPKGLIVRSRVSRLSSRTHPVVPYRTVSARLRLEAAAEESLLPSHLTPCLWPLIRNAGTLTR